MRKPAISDDFVLYLSEADINIGEPSTYKEAVSGLQREEWMKAMESELESMENNKVWELAVLPNGAKQLDLSRCLRPRRTPKGKLEI